MDRVGALFERLRSEVKLCSRCREVWVAPEVRWCRACKAAYMRKWRKAHPLTAEQRRKDIARSKAGVYYRRGLIVRQDCPCGSSDSQMHHPDYDQPYEVEWLCRPCHLKHHGVGSPP